MKKEPFLQVSKRRNKARWQERLLIRFIALILALIVCGAVIVALVKMNPVDVYKAIWDGAMGSERRLWQTIRDTMVLLCISIGLAPAFKMKFWNIGAEGQILMILEAMKMENEIMAPKAGRVVSVSVQKGASVESGTLLCVIG